MLAPWKKSYDKPRQCISKSRDITLPTKVCLVKAVVYPVVMYGYESWTIKKAEHQRTDAFELWCWRRLLTVPWTARRSNQSILKEISPEYSLERLRLKLQLQYFGHLIRRADSLEKTLMLGGIGGRRRRGWQRTMVGWHHRLNGHEFEQTPGNSEGQGSLACCGSWGRKESNTIERLNWTELRFEHTHKCYIQFIMFQKIISKEYLYLEKTLGECLYFKNKEISHIHLKKCMVHSKKQN